MRAALLIALAPLAFSTRVLAEGMDPSMPGMTMRLPAAKAPAKPPFGSAPARKPHHRTKHQHPRSSGSGAKSGQTAADMATMPGMTMPSGQAAMGQGQVTTGPAGGGQGMTGMPGMSTQPAGGVTAPGGGQTAAMPGMTGMDMSSPPGAAAPEAQVGNAPPPPPITDHAADRVFDPAAMAAARAQLHREHGGEPTALVIINIAEYQAHSDGGGYRWDGEASFGGDINRLFLKSEGEGTVRGGVDAAELQVLYSRAVSPYFDLQAGVRQDFQPTPERTYAAVGFDGLAPYWFEVSGDAFVSTKGEVLGRLEGYEDFHLTQRLILQPRAELNLAAQNMPQQGIGSGVTDLELGLRLRYEIKRELAPYIGVSYDQKLGATANFARARGERAGVPSVVFGVRTFF